MAVVLGVPTEAPQLNANSNFHAPLMNDSLISESRRVSRGNFKDALDILNSAYTSADTLRRVTEQSYAQKATNEFRARANEKLAQLQTLKGEDFINAYKSFDKEMDDLRSGISEKYPDQVVKDIFTISSQEIIDTAKTQASTSNIKATFDFKVDQLKASIAENTNEMVLNFNDPALRDKSLEKIKLGVASLADLQGLPKNSELSKQLERETLDKGIASAITYQIATKQFGSARNSLEQMKNTMEAPTYLKLKAKLQESIESEELKNALKAKQSRERFTSFKSLTPFEKEAILQRNYDSAYKSLKQTEPKLSDEERKAKAYALALTQTQSMIDEYESIGDMKAKGKIFLVKQGQKAYMEGVHTGKRPSELLSKEDYQLVHEVFGSVEAFDQKIINSTDVQGNANEFNRMTNGGKSGASLVYRFPNVMDLSNYCAQKGLNNAEEEKAIELYTTAKREQQENPKFSEKLLTDFSVLYLRNENDLSQLKRDLKIDPTLGAQLSSFANIYSQIERDARNDLKMSLDAPYTKTLEDLISFKFKQSQEAYEATIELEGDRLESYTDSLDDDYADIPIQDKMRYETECIEYYADTLGAYPTASQIQEFAIAKHKERMEGATQIHSGFDFSTSNQRQGFSPTRAYLR